MVVGIGGHSTATVPACCGSFSIPDDDDTVIPFVGFVFGMCGSALMLVRLLAGEEEEEVMMV